MRILFVTPYYAPAWAYGGPPKVMDELARQLVARGHQVTVYTTDARDGTRRMQTRRENRDGVMVYRFRNLSNWLAYHQKVFVPFGFARALRRTIRAYDVVHLSDFRTVQNGQAMGIARRSGVPFVLSAFGQLPRATGLKRVIKAGYDWRYGYRLLRSAGALLAQTENEAAWYRKLGAAPERISIVPLAIDARLFASLPPTEGFHTRHGIPPDAPIVLFLGRFHEYKGLDLLIRAFAMAQPQLPDVRLVLVGRDDGYEQTAHRLTETLGIADHVIWPGPLYEEDKLAAYAAADLFAFSPSHEEETSTAVLEALACGTPAIVTRQSEVPWLDAYDAGMTIEYDQTALGDAIAALLADRLRLAGMGENARRLIADHFTWERVIEGIEAAYDDATKRPQPSRGTLMRQLFPYGRIYGRLPAADVQSLYPDVGIGRVLPFVRGYLRLFGYPDIAGHVRFPLVRRLARPKPGDALLDAGCGTGIYSLSFAALDGVRATGIDLRQSRLDTANRLARALNVDATFSSMGVTELRIPDAQLDTIICVEVLEHVHDDVQAVREFARVLKPGGRLVITVPGKEDLTAEEETRRYATPEPLEHVRSGYTVQELRRLLEDAELTVTEYLAYYRWFAKVTIKAQQWLYLQHHPLLNIATSPLLTLIAQLDRLLPQSSWHRSHMICAQKPRESVGGG